MRASRGVVENPVVPSGHKRSDLSFDRVVVGRQIPCLEIVEQLGPLFARVIRRSTESALRIDLVDSLLDPIREPLQDRLRSLSPPAPPVPSRASWWPSSRRRIYV
jgi:Ni,Fe-hydrogenase III large subunit